MEALFQIGKDIGELKARLEKLEEKKCGCQGSSGRRALTESEMTTHQKAMGGFFKENSKAIMEAINNTLTTMMASKGISGQLFIRSFSLSPTPQTEEVCCQCCVNGNYCCGPCSDNCCNYS